MGPTFCLSVRYFLANEKKCRSLSNALFYNSLSAKKYRTYGTFSRNPRNRRVLDFVGKFFEFGTKYRTSGIFLRKVPNSLGKRQASTVRTRTVLFGGYRQKYRTYGTFWQFCERKYRAYGTFWYQKNGQNQCCFCKLGFSQVKLPPVSHFFNFRGQEKMPNVPKITGIVYLFFKVGPTFLELPLSMVLKMPLNL